VPQFQIRSYSDLVRKLLSLKGADAIHEVAETLLATIVLESELQHPEWNFLKGAHLFASGRQATAVPAAGLFSAVEMLNPAGSGVIMTPYLLVVDNQGAAQAFKLVQGPGALGGGIGRGIALDTRELLVTGAAEFRISAALGAALGGNEIERVNTNVNLTPERFKCLDTGFTLAPGARLSVGAINAVVATVCWYFYRERPAELSELPT